MTSHSPEYAVVHPLPRAPVFLGRHHELDLLVSHWAADSGGVLALVGLGGAGKTALAARFVADLTTQAHPLRPHGLFVWSFYQEPDPGLFLEQAHRYFAGTSAAASPARGAGLLHLLREVLSDGRRHLLVLDGLERVQHQGGPGSAPGGNGRVEDPLLRGLLTRIAEVTGRATALVTSRFPLTDLEPARGRGYRHLDVGRLDPDSAVRLLRGRGVRGEDRELAALAETYGGHPLTLDHLGGLIGRFLDGDPARAPQAADLTDPGGDRQALRLARLLRAYEDHLPPAELALLARLCLLRTHVDERQLLRLFVCAPGVHARGARDAAAMIARIPDPGRRPGEPKLALADEALAAIEEALVESPLSGPVDEFPRELFKAVEEVLTGPPEPDEAQIESLMRLYAEPGLDTPTDRAPLSAADRAELRHLGDLYREVAEHPFLSLGPKPHDALVEAFWKLGWGAPPVRGPEDLSPHDVEQRHRRLRHRLGRLGLKHEALRRVRAVCRLRQRKWALAGPLADLDAAAMCQAVAALTERHLVLREADGSFTVHPAVRDHFARLGDEAGRSDWHDLIREQLVSLSRRPGRGLPVDKQALDLIEEAIHHAQQAGRSGEAWALYDRGLGGLRHLGWRLGESARGLRILRGFTDCPDRAALGWYLRGLGELEAAYEANPMPYFRADVRLLQGRLPEVAVEGDPARTAIAAFLMGEAPQLPADLLGMAVPRAQLLLMVGRLREAWASPRLEAVYKDIGWEGDRARVHLVLAEVARRQADPGGCRRLLDAAAGWVLASGSVEHLCLWHLVRCRAERDAGELVAARRAAEEGEHAARQAGLGLYRVLLHCARAEVLLHPDASAAEGSAREALDLASAEGCRFLWGASEAGHLLGRALADQWRVTEAREAFTQALELRRRLGDPGAGQTAQLLARLPG
jgi:hypothetical protein